MRPCFLAFLFGALGLTGCDTISGVTRTASVHAVPDLPAIKARIESYPEVLEVKFSEAKGSQPITLTGLKPAEEVFYLYYTDHKDVYGTLMFTRSYKGDVSYSQTSLEMNRLPPQRWIDATWPVMKRIERDLIEDFGLPEIRDAVKVEVIRVEDPERKNPAPGPMPAGGAARP